MGLGAHGDLFDVRLYQQITPVNYVESNEPLRDMIANILILDGKLAEHLANHPISINGGGGGTVNTTGILSRFTDTFDNIAGGGTPPTPGTIGTDIDVLIFADGNDENQKFEITVPQDYAEGDLTFYVQFSMSGTGGGDVDFDISGEVAQINGTIVSFGPTTVGLVVTTTTNPQELAMFVLASTSFSAGDRIRIDFERQGSTDANADDFNLLGIDMRFTGFLLGNRASTQEIKITSPTDEPSATPGIIGTDIDTLDFDAATDREEKFQAIVPEEWDGETDPVLKITYAMSTAVGGSIARIATEGEVANISTGVQTLTTQQTDIAVPADTEAERSVSIPFPAGLFSNGSVFLIKVARRNTGVPSNHTGSFKILALEMIFNTPGVGGTTGGGFTEEYLSSGVFGNVSGAPTFAVDYPVFASDFEVLHSMLGTAPADRVDIAFQGRVPDGFSEIDELTVKIKGSGASPEYVLRVYAEGSGATPVYDPTSGTPIAAPGTLGTVTIPASSLSAQPISGRVFHVVVEAYIDTGETVFSSLPYVKYI
jgi:hypothetical protein